MGGASSDSLLAIAVGFDGRLAVGGLLTGDVALDDGGVTIGTRRAFGVPVAPGLEDAVVGVLSPEGRGVWASTFGGPDNDSFEAVGVDEAGNVYACGSFRTLNPDAGISAGGTRDAVLVSFDRDGNLRWSRNWGLPGLSDGCSALVVTPSGEVVATGFYEAAAPGSVITVDGLVFPSTGGLITEIYVIAFGRDDGRARWLQTFGGPLREYVGGAALMPDGTVVVVGTEGQLPPRDAFLVRITKGTQPVSVTWSGMGDDVVAGVAVDWEGNIVVTGSTTSPTLTIAGQDTEAVSDTDLLVFSLTPSLDLRWLRRVAGADVTASGRAIAVNAHGDVALAGTYAPRRDADGGVRGPGALDLGGGALPTVGVVGGNNAAMFVAELHGADGGVLWSRGFTSNWVAAPTDMTTDDDGRLHVVAQLGGTMDVDGRLLGLDGGVDGVLLSFQGSVPAVAAHPDDPMPYFASAARWTDFVQTERGDPFNALDAPCAVDAGPLADECIHGGEMRSVRVGGLKDCSRLTAQDTLDAFDWTCVPASYGARMVSRLKPSRGLRDLIDVEAAAWRPSVVVVLRDGKELFRTTERVWWDNPVHGLDGVEDGGAVNSMTLNIPHAVYVLKAPRARYVIDGNHVSALGGLPQPLTLQPGTTGPVLLAQSVSFLWLELSAVAQSMGHTVELSNTSFVTARPLAVSGSGGAGTAGLRLNNVRASRFHRITATDNKSAGISLVDSVGNHFEDTLVVRTTAPASAGLSVLRGGGNVVEELRMADCFDGIVLTETSGNLFTGTNVSNCRLTPIVIEGSHNNVFTDTLVAASSAGPRLKALPANNAAVSTGNALLALTAVHNSTPLRLADGAHRNTVASLIAIDPMEPALDVRGPANTLADVLSTPVGPSSETYANYFTGKLFAVADSCQALDGGTGGLTRACSPAPPSDFTLHPIGGLPGGTFVGPVVTDEVNTSDSRSGSDEYAAAPYSATVDWQRFENPYRAWGLPGSDVAAQAATAGAWTASTGQIWDWSLSSESAVIRGALELPTGDDVLLHLWFAPTFLECDAIAGAAWETTCSMPPFGPYSGCGDVSGTSIEGCISRHLRHAYELASDDIGNDNGLCESSETCLYTPNLGAYQGHGPLVSAGSFVDGTLHGITLLRHVHNGYPEGAQGARESLAVPGGAMALGCGPGQAGGAACDGDETPEICATVRGFELDRFEVTEARFRLFVEAVIAGWRPEPGSGQHGYLAGETGWRAEWSAQLPTTPTAWDDALMIGQPGATWSTEASLPINHVTWYQAYAFCIWDGGFLPTETEWERAAAGGEEERLYPWGTAAPTVSHVKANCVGNCAEPVGSKPLGAGRWGHDDLAGNLREWTLDGYAADAFARAGACHDCVNPPGDSRVLRGGSFGDTLTGFRVTERHEANPTAIDATAGFRCARLLL